MKKQCTLGLSLSDLMKLDEDLLVLIGADEDEAEPGDSEDEDDDKSSDEDNDDGDDEDEDDKSEDPRDAKIKALDAEKERHYKRRKDAEKKLAEANKEIEELKKGGTTDEAVRTELTELRSENETLKAGLRKQAIAAAASNSDIKFKNSDAALRLADLDDVEVDDDGTVHGLSSALQAVAEANPYMVEGAEEKKPKPRVRKTADDSKRTPTAQQKDQQRQANLQKKYPGLRKGRG